MYKQSSLYFKCILIFTFFYPLTSLLLEKGIRKVQSESKENRNKFSSKYMFGINLVNIGLYLVYFLSNNKIDFFDNEKYYKLQKKLNDSLFSEKSKRFKELCNILKKKLSAQAGVAGESKDFRAWLDLKLPETPEDFEIIELKHLIELSLNYRHRDEFITMSELNLLKATQLIKASVRLCFYSEKNLLNKGHLVCVSDSHRKIRDKFKFRSRSSKRASQRLPRSADKRKERLAKEEAEGGQPHSKSEEEAKNKNSLSSDDDERESEENSFQLNNQVFVDFVSQLDKEFNYISFLEQNDLKTDSEFSDKLLAKKRYNIKIWRFNLFAYSLEKIKKCKICKAFLPEAICESGQEIIPYFSENKNNRGLIMYHIV